MRTSRSEPEFYQKTHDCVEGSGDTINEGANVGGCTCADGYPEKDVRHP